RGHCCPVRLWRQPPLRVFPACSRPDSCRRTQPGPRRPRQAASGSIRRNDSGSRALVRLPERLGVPPSIQARHWSDTLRLPSAVQGISMRAYETLATPFGRFTVVVEHDGTLIAAGFGELDGVRHLIGSRDATQDSTATAEVR